MSKLLNLLEMKRERISNNPKSKELCTMLFRDEYGMSIKVVIAEDDLK